MLKGNLGVANAQVVQHNAGDVAVASIVDNRTDGSSVSQPVSLGALVGTGLAIPRLDPRPLTLAFYYPWFHTGIFNSGTWAGIPTGAFDTSDPASETAMMAQAAGAGINGFIYSWNGKDSNDFDTLLQLAANRGDFSIAPYFELAAIQQQYGNNPDAIAAVAEAALQRASNPAFLHVGTRPVLFVFGTWAVTAQLWAQVRSDFQTAGVNPFIIGDRPDVSFGFDGVHEYDVNKFDANTLVANMQYLESTVQLLPQVDPSAPQRLWAATVSPGTNTVHNNPQNPTIRSRDNGARFSQSWADALAAKPDWVLITSWNEWFEATNVQPDTVNGQLALGQIATWSTQFRSSR
jgi:hypothetical protein